jgi:hypothetical protein
MSPGAGAILKTIYGSGSLLFYQRLEEILQKKIMVLKIPIRKPNKKLLES